MARILLVEDEEHLADAIILNLELDNHQVVWANNGKKALDVFKSERFDLILLDVMLPEIDGFTVCETIRLENGQIPILMMTAKGASSDRINGLKIGADDYLVKPFDLEELLLRINKLLKRSVESSKDELVIYTIGTCTIDFKKFEIKTINGKQQLLSKKEILLLKLLIEKEGQVVSRQEILEKVWGYDVYPSTRTIDNFILAYRKYFEANPKEPLHFHSVRGVGYKFTK
jgi:two-component system, OmpR family, alkaline phosphatase synthesis response regulator PhoP